MCIAVLERRVEQMLELLLLLRALPIERRAHNIRVRSRDGYLHLPPRDGHTGHLLLEVIERHVLVSVRVLAIGVSTGGKRRMEVTDLSSLKHRRSRDACMVQAGTRARRRKAGQHQALLGPHTCSGEIRRPRCGPSKTQVSGALATILVNPRGKALWCSRVGLLCVRGFLHASVIRRLNATVIRRSPTGPVSPK